MILFVAMMAALAITAAVAAWRTAATPITINPSEHDQVALLPALITQRDFDARRWALVALTCGLVAGLGAVSIAAGAP